MKKQFVKPEIKGIRLRENILAGSGSNIVCNFYDPNPEVACNAVCTYNNPNSGAASRRRMSF